MIGKTVSHYKITRELGAGGMGVVYEAVDTKLDRTVALKFLPPESTRDPDAKARFVHEAKAASAIDHPNVCNIYEIDETDDGQLFLAMARYEGETLKDRIGRGPLPLDDALEITRQVAEGLTEAHAREIVHRDIKSTNIFITESGLVKILDFGLAKLSGLTQLTKTGATMGTGHYMSPEQAAGRETDNRTDLWSLGVVLYEMVTGRVPFGGDHLQAVMYAIQNTEPEPVTGLRTGVPRELERIIGKCLAKDAAERYQHAEDLQADLLHLKRESEPSRSETLPPEPESVRSPRRWPWMLRFLGLGAVAVLVAGVFWPIGTPIPSGEEMALAIMDIRDLGADDDTSVSLTATELLHTAMVESCPIRIQSPEYLRDVRRRRFGGADAAAQVDQDLELARMSGATYLLTGRVGRVDNEQVVTWRLVHVDDGQSIGAGRVAASGMMEMIDQIVGEAIEIVVKSSGTEARVEQVPVGSITSESSIAYRHYITGKQLIELGKGAEGARELEAAVAIDSTFAAAHLELARYHFHRGGTHVDITRSRAYADTARRFENRLGTRERLSLEAFQYGLDYRVRKELAALREIAERWPDDRSALRDLQIKSYWWWYFSDAVKLGDQGYALYPDEASFVGHEYFASLSAMGRGAKAHAAALRYRDLRPDEGLAWENLGSSWLMVGEPDSAHAAILRAHELDPSWSVRSLAAHAAMVGDHDLAARILSDALSRRDPENTQRYGLMFGPCYGGGCLTTVFFQSGRWQEAVATMNDALKYTGADPTLWQWQAGRILTLTGNPGLALQMAREMELSDEIRSRVFAYRFKGLAQAALGDMTGARATAQRTRELAEDMGPFMLYYALKVEAEIGLLENDPTTALASLKEMEQIARGSNGIPYYVDRRMMAKACRLAGDIDSAINTLLEVLRTHQGAALCHFDLGKIYEEAGLPGNAAEEYGKFLKLWAKADEGLPQLNEARERLAALEIQH